MPGDLKIRNLLEDIKCDFPRRKQELYAVAANDPGLDDFVYSERSVVVATELPTFDAQEKKRISPLLKERFDYAGEIRFGYQIWLDPKSMRAALRDPEIRDRHESLRTQWPESAPAQFSDHDLGVFAITEDVPEDITYLVWKSDPEPEFWVYAGYNSYHFENLRTYLYWCLTRD